MGRTIALYSDTGGGKTTQIGEYAKYVWKTTGKKTRLFSSDLGGYDSIDHLVSAGIIDPVAFDPEVNDPWTWINSAVEGALGDTKTDYGCNAFDSGTSMAEQLLSSCAKLSANGEDIGGRPAPKFIINKKGPVANQIKIGSNVDSHYLTVQGVMRDNIWRSTWLAKKGDVLWTFGLYRGESQFETPIYGPQVAGKALTPLMPKWFNYTFPLVKEVIAGQAPKHRLLLQSQPDAKGLAFYYANARYPLGASQPLPLHIEPASLADAMVLLDQAKEEAALAAKTEMGL
jgi:hypothetical protein